jgi:predicted branched-subunit amino acid permease
MTILVLIASVAVINLRLVLLSAALRPWIGYLDPRAVYPTVMMISEPNWLIGMRYKAGGGQDAGVVFGSGLLLWIICVAMTIVGHLFGTIVADPKRYGLDLITVLMFAIMCVNFWKGHRDTLAWCVAGVSAVVVWWLIPGYWFVLVGAVAGAATAALIEPRAVP